MRTHNKFITGAALALMVATSTLSLASCGQNKADVGEYSLTSGWEDNYAEYWLTMPGLQLTCEDMKAAKQDLLWKLYSNYRIFSIDGTNSHDSDCIDGMDIPDVLAAAEDGAIREDGMSYVKFTFVCPDRTELGVTLTFIGSADGKETARELTLYGIASEGEAYVESPFEIYRQLMLENDLVFHASYDGSSWHNVY